MRTEMSSSRYGFVLFSVFSVLTVFGYQAHSIDVKGETQYNYLRHSVAVSNTDTTYGKHGSTLLGRSVVSVSRIWSTVDEFTKSIYENPERLDWYIADIGTDGDSRSVTINAGFSCIDLGKSNSDAISWWVAEGLSKDTKNGPGVGGINRFLAGTDGSFNDILARCLRGRQFEKGRRLVEHHGQHRGTGVKMIKPSGTVDKPISIVGDNLAFQRFAKERQQHDRSDEVVYDEKSGIGVVEGLPFDSGFRIHAPDEYTTGKSRDLRVPMTPLGGITTHIGARLRETRVDRGESRTSNVLLLLTVWASCLALLLAVCITCKAISDTLVDRSEKNRLASVSSAVQGSGGWSVSEKAILIANFAAVTILLAPIGQAFVEGNIDPRSAIEVHYGANIYYTDSGQFSEDDGNPIAGAIFFVSSWITVRPLDDGFVAALTFSMVVIFFFAIVIAMRVSKKSSEIMRSSQQQWRGFSLWKLSGYLRLWLKSKPGRNSANYKVLLKLRADAYPFHGVEALEDGVKEIALLAHETWRERAKICRRRKTGQHRIKSIREAARQSAYTQIRNLQGTGCIGLFARVNLHDKRRFRVATSGTTPWQDAMDRNWEYIRRGADCESIEWYRTNGRYPPDRALVLVQLGLLKYAKFILEVTIAADEEGCEYDGDGVRCYVAVAASADMEKLMDGRKDGTEGVPRIVERDQDGIQPRLFRRRVASDVIEVSWAGGTSVNESHAESAVILKYCIVDASDLSDEETTSAVT